MTRYFYRKTEHTWQRTVWVTITFPIITVWSRAAISHKDVLEVTPHFCSVCKYREKSSADGSDICFFRMPPIPLPSVIWLSLLIHEALAAPQNRSLNYNLFLVSLGQKRQGFKDHFILLGKSLPAQKTMAFCSICIKRFCTPCRRHSRTHDSLKILKSQKMWWLQFSLKGQPCVDACGILCETLDRVSNLGLCVYLRVSMWPCERRVYCTCQGWMIWVLASVLPYSHPSSNWDMLLVLKRLLIS